jgi:hypothetical protein
MEQTTTDTLTFRPVTIVNEEEGSRVPFSLSDSRRAQLVDLIRDLQQSPLPVPEPWGDGVDSSAVVGMQLLFDFIPHKFPVHSILLWLREDIDSTVPLTTVEAALAKLARMSI